MSLARMVARGRAAAERLMTDTCTITRITGESEGEGGVVSSATTKIYTGPCRVKTRGTEARGTDVGQAYRIVSRRVVQLPATVTGLAEGDRVTITASTDADLVGKIFTVQDMDRSSLSIRHEVTVVEVTS